MRGNRHFLPGSKNSCSGCYSLTVPSVSPLVTEQRGGPPESGPSAPISCPAARIPCSGYSSCPQFSSQALRFLQCVQAIAREFFLPLTLFISTPSTFPPVHWEQSLSRLRWSSVFSVWTRIESHSCHGLFSLLHTPLDSHDLKFFIFLNSGHYSLYLESNRSTFMIFWWKKRPFRFFFILILKQ